MSNPNPSCCRPQELLDTVGGDKDIFLELCEIFLRESSRQFLELKSSAAVGDLSVIRRQSHALKGTVGPMAPDKLLQLLQQLEDDCKLPACDCGNTRISRIGQELEQVAAEVRQYVARLAA